MGEYGYQLPTDQPKETSLSFEGLELIPENYQVFRSGKEIVLTGKEFETLAVSVCLRLDLYREKVVFSLNEKVHLIRRVALGPVARNHFKLCNKSLQHKIFGQCALELGEQAVALSESRGS